MLTRSLLVATALLALGAVPLESSLQRNWPVQGNDGSGATLFALGLCLFLTALALRAARIWSCSLDRREATRGANPAWPFFLASVTLVLGAVLLGAVALERIPRGRAYVPSDRPRKRQTPGSGPMLFVWYCASCHSLQGQRVIGPPLGELYGSRVELQDGRMVLADAAYIRRSILSPSADLRVGYQNLMDPSFRSILSDQDIDTIVEFLREFN